MNAAGNGCNVYRSFRKKALKFLRDTPVRIIFVHSQTVEKNKARSINRIGLSMLKDDTAVRGRLQGYSLAEAVTLSLSLPVQSLTSPVP